MRCAGAIGPNSASLHNMHAYMHTYMYACIHAYIHACMHTCVHAYIHAYIHACMRTYMHTYMHAHIHACTYMHTSMYTCIHTCIHAYRHVAILERKGRVPGTAWVRIYVFTAARRPGAAELAHAGGGSSSTMEGHDKKLFPCSQTQILHMEPHLEFWTVISF